MSIEKIKRPLHFIKYMGSKTKILLDVTRAIDSVYTSGPICDLFAGSCSLSSVLNDKYEIISNDIQKYSAVIGAAYLLDWNDGTKNNIDDIIQNATDYFNRNYKKLISEYSYPDKLSLKQFKAIEEKNRSLINVNFKTKWHLFTRYYSGTWWSAEQCAWIDSLKKAIENYKDSSYYNTLLASLMYAMAYSSQGTGHYAQYRVANTNSSMKDILIYRKRNLVELFVKKASEALNQLGKKKSCFKHIITTLDYLDCLKKIPKSTIYAAPPYCFVHYSRFYHAIETLALYDYPEIQLKGGEMVKGRYRVDRHQSPFCIRTQVKKAFSSLFKAVALSKSNMVLSYSNAGMITLKELLALAEENLGQYDISIQTMDHTHMTMGRKGDRSRDVKEALICLKRRDR